MRYWPSMALVSASVGERAGDADSVAIRGVDVGIRGSTYSFTGRLVMIACTWASLVDGLVEVEAEAVGGDQEEDAHFCAVVVVHA